MIKYLRTLLLNLFSYFLLLAQALLYLCSAADAGQPGLVGQVPHEVLAFYYGWYGNPAISGHFEHWRLDATGSKIVNSRDTPINGAYDSHNGSVIREQLQEAKAAGITGFIVSWWGKDNFTDKGLSDMLAEAALAGLKITVYIEKFPTGADALTLSKQVAELDYVIKTYSQSPAWLRVGERPVVFVYASALKAGGDQWRRAIDRARVDYPSTDPIFIADVSYGLSTAAQRQAASYVPYFDGVHGYSIRGMRQRFSLKQNVEIAQENFAQWRVGISRLQITCDTVMPGYDDTALTERPLPRPTVLRNNGSLYSALWKQAIADNPDWILIDSWSEWHEGTEIEPSVEYGQLYLDITAKYSRNFLMRKVNGH